MTQAGTMLGTPAYMSPEQFRGEVVDARTDVYSAGVVLYQLLTGERPFEGGLTAIMHKVLTTEPPVPSQLAGTCPPSMDAVVKRAMAKRPDDRYPSAAAFAEAIRSALAAPAAPSRDDDSEATMVGATLARAAPAAARAAAPPPAARAVPATPVPTPAPTRSRLPLLIGVGVAAVLAAGTGAWFVLGSSQHAPAPAAPGQQAAGQPAAGLPATGQPAGGPPASGQPASGPLASGQPASGQLPAPGAGSAPTTTAQTAPAVPQQQPASPVTAAPAAAPATAPATALPTAPPIGPAPTPAPQALPVSAPTQEATTDLHTLRQQLEQALAQAPCTLANGLVQDSGTVTVDGYAGRATADLLRQQLGGVLGAAPLDWRVRPVDQVFCSALGALRPIAVQAGGPVSGLSVTLAGGQTTLHDGDRIMPRITMADFAGLLRVDYLGHDGSVVHLYPTAADPAQHVEARPATRLAPGAQLSIGEGGPGRPIWEVGPPYGTDMIIAIASSTPLLTRAPGQNAADDAAPYLRDLESGIARVRQAGGRVSGTLLLVDTLPK